MKRGNTYRHVQSTHKTRGKLIKRCLCFAGMMGEDSTGTVRVLSNPVGCGASWGHPAHNNSDSQFMATPPPPHPTLSMIFFNSQSKTKLSNLLSVLINYIRWYSPSHDDHITHIIIVLFYLYTSFKSNSS
jgi:hypothetical protein